MTWQYPSNFSNGTIVTNLGDFFKYMNYTTNNTFGYGILLVIFLISFAVGLVLGPKKAIAGSSFISMIFSVYLVMMGLIHISIPFILGLIMIVSVIGAKEERY